MKNKTKLSAFTLIELLIVIAIIGILAGLMAGGISAAMDSAKATTIGNNGRNIVQAIMQANNDRVASALSELWPRAEAKAKPKTFTDSNGYFARLMKNQLIDGIAFADFAGGGVAAAKDATELENGGCVWNALAGVAGLDSYAPFIWTRNLANLIEDDFEESKTDSLKDKLVATTNPFQAKRVVLVRKGGAMVDIKASLLTYSTFLGGASNVVEGIAILKAKEGDSSGSNDDWDN